MKTVFMSALFLFIRRIFLSQISRKVVTSVQIKVNETETFIIRWQLITSIKSYLFHQILFYWYDTAMKLHTPPCCLGH
jgi:hypothetical protein